MATDWRNPAETFDDVYELYGMAPQVGFFNPRPLIPVEDLNEQLASPGRPSLTDEEVEAALSRGWVRVGPIPDDDKGRDGIPMYGVLRIRYLLEMEREGYTEGDLQEMAQEDEELVQDLVEFGVSYDDTDPLVVVAATDRELERATRQLEWSENALQGERPALEDGTWPEDLVTEETVADLRERIHHLNLRRGKWQRFSEVPPDRWTPDARREIAKAAFLVREQDERTRFLLWQWHRDQMLEGFGPLIVLDDPAYYEARVDWEETLTSPRFLSRPQPVRLRIPGAILEGERLTMTSPRTPHQYRQFFKRWDLDRYFQLLAEVRERRICANCLKPLAEDADPRAVYCDERCRNAGKGRAWREKNPRRAKQHQIRYLQGRLDQPGDGDSESG